MGVLAGACALCLNGQAEVLAKVLLGDLESLWQHGGSGEMGSCPGRRRRLLGSSRQPCSPQEVSSAGVELHPRLTAHLSQSSLLAIPLSGQSILSAASLLLKLVIVSLGNTNTMTWCCPARGWSPSRVSLLHAHFPVGVFPGLLALLHAYSPGTSSPATGFNQKG